MAGAGRTCWAPKSGQCPAPAGEIKRRRRQNPIFAWRSRLRITNLYQPFDLSLRYMTPTSLRLDDSILTPGLRDPTGWDRMAGHMKAVFVESTEFTSWVTVHLPDDEYFRLQQALMDQPDKGTVMPGCGGLRKIRTSDPARGKGKRGGARVIYLYVPEARWFFLLDVYGKDEKDDLSAAEKRALSQLTRELKHQAKAAVSGRERRKT